MLNGRFMIDEKGVLEKLRKVIDPELGVNIVELGLIYKITVEGKGKVAVLMTLTSPGCPFTSLFEKMVDKAIRKLEGVSSVGIELTFDPPWTQEMMSEEVRAQLGF